MTQPTGVNTTDSPTDDRGVPLQNLQAEMTRKIADMEAKMAERLEAITQKLETFSQVPDAPPVETAPSNYDEREELRKISAAPRRYVEELVRPLKEENEQLKKEIEQTRTFAVKSQWEKMEDTIARMEGKKDWKELPNDLQNGVINIVKEKGWFNNPSSALDAYELYQARKAKTEEPDRAARIAASTTEGSGRLSGKTPARTVSRSTVEELAATHPKDPDYKKNMETLSKIQSGTIKIE